MNNKERSVALFDLDKTIYNDHSFFPLAKFLVDEGVLLPIIWDEIANELSKYRQKMQTYSLTASNLLQIFGSGIKGKNYSEIYQKTVDFFQSNKKNFYPYFEKILPVLRQTHDVILVTTNSQMAAEAVVTLFNLDGLLSTQFEVVDGMFTGGITSSLADGKHVVEELVGKYGGSTMAFGDSENDIGMMEKVKYPVCINPAEELSAVARARGWSILSTEEAEEGIMRILR